MFNKRTTSSKRADNPESLENESLINARPEIASRPELQVCHDRKVAVMRASSSLENTFAVQFHRTGNTKVATAGLHIMRGVAKAENVSLDEAEVLSPVQPKPETANQKSTPPVEAAQQREDANVIRLDEHRARYLLEKDAHRQVVEAYEAAGQVEAEMVSVPTPTDDQLIPDLAVTEETPFVIEARKNVDAVMSEVERLQAANRQAELEVERDLLAAQRVQERAAA